MADAYMVFGIGLAGVAILGLAVSRWSGCARVEERTDVLVAVVGSLTAAGFLSLSFLADKLAETGFLIDQSPGSDLGNALGMVLWMLSVGASGLLAALVCVLSSKKFVTRWAIGGLAVAAVSVVGLFPAAVVLVLLASDAASPLVP